MDTFKFKFNFSSPKKATFGIILGFFFFLQAYLFLVEGKLLHNIGLASAIHQPESATGRPAVPSLFNLPPPPTPGGCYRALV